MTTFIKSNKVYIYSMLEYILPFLAYVLVEPIFNSLTANIYVSYLMKVFITLLLLLAFIKSYNLRFKFRLSSFFVGLAIFLLWIFIPFSFSKGQFAPPTSFFLLVKFFGGVFIAPFVEELFTRSFLIRIFVRRNWERVKVGTFTWPSFIITVLFFGFSHSMWLAGLVVGVILNLWLYKTKSVEQCIIAHSFANLLLFFYVISTSAFSLW